MLLAEIHGKRCIEAEGNEDWLTSAVFGHLRQVRDGAFWRAVFGKAQSVREAATTLLHEIETEHVNLQAECEFSVSFWPSYKDYGEPDLLLRFSGIGMRSLLLIIEVKLFSYKSECGPNDQLKRYYDLLHDKAVLGSMLDEIGR